jgi:hypothetical protein
MKESLLLLQLDHTESHTFLLLLLLLLLLLQTGLTASTWCLAV